MEYNKDEAYRAKEIAERKLSEKDFNGAKKFLLKAHQLYPSVEGFQQMSDVLDVYLAAEKKVNGHYDWYGILQVDLSADEGSIKRQYRKLALLLHPDKNKCVGAEGAFKLIGEAWTVLSDKTRKLQYDQKRNSDFLNVTQHNPHQSPNFWTICPFCANAFQYPRVYISRTLLCVRCQKPFVALEVQNPAFNGVNVNFGVRTGTHSSNRYSNMQGQHEYPNASASMFKKNSKQKSSANVNTAFGSKASVEEAVKVEDKCRSKGGETSSGKPAKKDGVKTNGLGNSKKVEKDKKTRRKRKKIVTDTSSDSDIEDLENEELDDDDILEAEERDINKSKDSEENGEMHEGKENGVKETDANGKTVQKKTRKARKASDGESQAGGNGSREKVPENLDVPDANFYNFDMDRMEQHFEEGQIWAIYDEMNLMPRFYGRIVSVISRENFKVKIVWLEVDSSEPAVKRWVEEGFYPSCGNYRSGGRKTINSLGMFSHPVKFSKNSKGVFTIYPQKDDIWAMYKNWDSTWKKETPDEITRDYEMVIIVSDWGEGVGVNVTPLSKVEGFVSVYEKHQDIVRTVPSSEFLRFSHQVPAKKLSEEEAPDLSQRCWELDPAATVHGDP
eukprot:TRINITY_DN4292_c0_g1_i1.p1 TRINITY_DN4292_c0_g1~~TRINITY_DN4292_c0_g1_i1.p1  ORF type:complete len:614 (+),score=107.01 TRINITY_DN4292_c0_g1_i1:349-2190(+)